ncbi:FIST signal transduction protein [Piscinibacter sakaiensis]|uniref:FIST signal transduction protein n=1 Tax=Piscinibacter sakaiensis TaxID=1547922 RepID=UPI003AB0AA06
MSMRSHSALCRLADSTAAGLALGREIRDAIGAADAIIVFASSQHDYQRLLEGLREASGCATLVGSSSAGEFNNSGRGVGWASAMALSSPSMKFALGVGRDLSRDPQRAATELISDFGGLGDRPLPYRCALVMTDALAGHTDQLLEHLTVATRGSYNFVGGGAGDDGHFARTHVFAGTQALTDAVVALEIQSMQPVGIGVAHGWTPAGPPLRVTEADGPLLIGLNGAPAAAAFEDHAEASGQTIDRDNALPFLLHNVLGIENGNGYRLRVPLSLNPDGSVSCAAAVPVGSIVHIMKTSTESAVEAASSAARSAVEALGGRQPKAALVFDCVATRLRLGDAFQNELDACSDILKPASFTGCNTYGQIARAAGQFGGFHNCTAVVCVFPE